MKEDITQTSQTDMANLVTDYSVDTMNIDGAEGGEESKYSNPNFTKWLGYYKTTAIKKPIDAYATWVTGRGLEKENAAVNNLSGWGEDSFLAIMWNMLVVKKFNGDAYSHAIRNDKGTMINLKPLNPGRMSTITGPDGMIIRYEQRTARGETKKYKPQEILHLCNDRIADEIHGVSVCEVAEWGILARKEAMVDWKRISHRSTIRVLYVDEQDKTRLADLRKDYAEGIKNGEVLLLPCRKEDASFEDLTLPPVEAFLAWIRYLENSFYKDVGMPKSLTGDAEGIPESGGKMAYVNHQPNYNKEVTDLEADLWNQLALRVKFKRQDTLMPDVNNQENKNNAQTGFQPNDVQVKTE